MRFFCTKKNITTCKSKVFFCFSQGVQILAEVRRLDIIDPNLLRPAFKKAFALAQRGKVLEPYQFFDGYYLFSTDGTGYFSSSTVHCANCCVKNHHDGSHTYYHNMMGGAIVHPDRKEVIPFCPEPIKQSDGMKKNDCEQLASRRQLQALRREHPHLKVIVLQDALGDSGPNIQSIESLCMKYIIVSKRDPLKNLDHFQISTYEHRDESGTLYKYTFANQIPVNQLCRDLEMNCFECVTYTQGKKKKATWITNIPITRRNIHQLMKGGRSRWKIENETFNTLKNQGYHFEHNFGHGSKNLCSAMSFLMMLAFLIDQLQQICCKSYQEAKSAARTYSSLWEKMRTFFCYILLKDWEYFLGLISRKIILDTS